MQELHTFNKQIKLLFTDIDDTMTEHGLLPAESYSALWKLKKNGIDVVPVTGRPAGWCEMIARMWPVRGVIGENGALYFSYKQKQMHRQWIGSAESREQNRQKLNMLSAEILKQVPGSAVASDQFCRLYDLAIDFCEDVPALPKSEVQKIVSLFQQVGATAKVSSIHVNGWFGSYDKLSMAKTFVEKEFGWNEQQLKQYCAFSGDSPNDEPMFAYFPNSFAVANIKDFLSEIKAQPNFVAPSKGATGFCEIAEQLLRTK